MITENQKKNREVLKQCVQQKALPPHSPRPQKWVAFYDPKRGHRRVVNLRERVEAAVQAANQGEKDVSRFFDDLPYRGEDQ